MSQNVNDYVKPEVFERLGMPQNPAATYVDNGQAYRVWLGGDFMLQRGFTLMSRTSVEKVGDTERRRTRTEWFVSSTILPPIGKRYSEVSLEELEEIHNQTAKRTNRVSPVDLEEALSNLYARAALAGAPA